MTDKKNYEPQDQTPEENTQNPKAQAFAANPDQFEDLSKVLLSVKRDPNTGQIMVLNNCRDVKEALEAQGAVVQNIVAFANHMMITGLQVKSQQIKQNGNFLQNLRNSLRKK